MMEPEEMDEHTQEALLHVARVLNKSAQEVVSEFEKLWQAVGEAVVTIVEKLRGLELTDLPRPPAEIKKDIKYERNPMRLKQLNKELNESYKAYKRK